MDEGIEPARLISAIWRNKLWVALSGMLCLFVGTWYAFAIATPVYSASAKLVLETREQKLANIDSVVAGLSGDQATLKTEAQVITSRVLVQRLVDDLGLGEDAEFNPSLSPKPRVSVHRWVTQIQSTLGLPQPARMVRTTDDIKAATVDAVMSAIHVESVSGSLAFVITATTQDSRKSAAIANRLAAIYIEDQIQVKFDKTKQATAWLTDRVTELQIELEAAEDKLKDFGSNAELVSAEGLVALNRQLKDFRERRDQLTVSMQAQKAALAPLQDALAAQDFNAITAATRDPELLRLGQTGSDAKALLTRAQTVLHARSAHLSRTQAQLAAVSASIADVDRRIATQSDELIQLQQLQREADASRLIYDAFLSRLKETSVQQGIQQADARILSPAIAPRRAIAPRKSLIAGLSLILGLVLGACSVVFRDLTQATFRSAAELETQTGIAVLAQVPIIPASARSDVINHLIDHPNSPAAEAIRTLRTSLLLSNLDADPQIIMSTSSLPREGKTTQSIALALNFAQMGQRVLLIEGDLRRRLFDTYFDTRSETGYLSVLAGKAPLDTAIQSTPIPNCDLLLGEATTINAADVFSARRFTDMLDELRTRYDRIIIDTPPVLAVPDAQIIGQLADAVVYTVKWDSTPRRQVIEGVRTLTSVNVRISGFVLGQINPRTLRKYGYDAAIAGYAGYGCA